MGVDVITPPRVLELMRHLKRISPGLLMIALKSLDKETTKAKIPSTGKTLFSPINLTASGARLARMPSAVLSTLEASCGSAEAARPNEEGWVGVQRKVTLGKGRTGVESMGPT